MLSSGSIQITNVYQIDNNIWIVLTTVISFLNKFIDNTRYEMSLITPYCYLDKEDWSSTDTYLLLVVY